jgi:hypothetical protein
VAGMAPFAQRRVGSARKRVRRVWGSKSRRSSPRGVSVLVDDSHEDAGTYQPAEVEVLHGTGLIRSLRRSLVSGPVWSVPVVILIRGKDVPGMGLVHDQHLIEDLASDGADHPLAVGIHQRAAAQFPRARRLGGQWGGLVRGWPRGVRCGVGGVVVRSGGVVTVETDLVQLGSTNEFLAWLLGS